MNAKTYDQIVQGISLVIILCVGVVVLVGILRLVSDYPGYIAAALVAGLAIAYAAHKSLKARQALK